MNLNAGKEVVTKNGHNVLILCTDNEDHYIGLMDNGQLLPWDERGYTLTKNPDLDIFDENETPPDPQVA